MPLKNSGLEEVTAIQSLMMTSDPCYSCSKVRREQYALSCAWADAGSSLACMYLLFFSRTHNVEARD